MILQQLEDRETFIESHSSRVNSSKLTVVIYVRGLGRQSEDTAPSLFILRDQSLINSRIMTAPTSFISCINSKLFWLSVKSQPGQHTHTEETKALSSLNQYQSYYRLSKVSIRSNLASINVVRGALTRLFKSAKMVEAKNAPSSELHCNQWESG